jgi:DNA recombination protein RmuC
MRVSAEGLRIETGQLVTALRAPQVRGRWGELQLERTVEAAGMVEHIDYVTQASVTGPEGTMRPDLVVKLAGGKHIVVDAKVAFAGYLEAMEATDDRVRSGRLRAHARQLRIHVDALAAKAYWDHFDPTPEFVVCFVPADAFLDAALREDPALLEHAFARNVVLATPSTLVALLRTIGYSWRQDALARNTAEVSKLGRELYQRLSTMTGHLDKMGRSLSAAVTSFNASVGTLETRVLVSARRLADLSVVDSQVDGRLRSAEQILGTTRSVAMEPEVSQVP